ncbi:MAG: 2-C-methyl-D-erythritol 4-phosphate cytidylyltransferase [Verrucomicrobia bacterium]|nr:2-C-methyl-D-erythritol 4-phosphate cytidylyltransferase [Verrucomicrobiota bacterium]
MTSAIILAGGSSKRMGTGVDKLMIHMAGMPLLVHALLAFERCRDVDEIILVAREDRRSEYRELAAKHRVVKLISVIPGGIERQDSVWCGLQAISRNSEIVLVHDGARALVTAEIISRCAMAARQTGAAIPAARVKDTIKRAASLTTARGDEFRFKIEETLDRSHLWAAQTPQTFRTELLRKAYEPLVRARTIVTDDAMAVERLGHPVALVECDPLNLKITTPEDLLLAEAILSKRAPTS